MSAAPAAEPTTTAEPTIDDLFAQAAEELTTRTSEPAAETPTPEKAPVSEPKREGEQADTDTPQARERDASGRFAGAPAATGREEGDTPAQEAAPAEAAPPAAPPHQPRQGEPQTYEEALRTIHSLRGNVDNAAKQAAAQAAAEARQAALAEAEANERERINRILREHEAAGEDVSAARAAWQKEWAEKDRAKRETEDNQRRAGLVLSEVDNSGQQRLLTLYHEGTAQLAQDTGLGVEEVRALWSDPEERQRFLRASFQSDMARKLPGAGFNAQALQDYMGTMVGTASQLAALKKGHAAEVAALRKENEKLQQAINRLEGPDVPPELPARGTTARRKEAETTDEAYAELQRRISANRELVRS